MGDYDWEMKDTLEKIGNTLTNIAGLLENIRDKMPPLEEDPVEVILAGGGLS